MASRKCICDLSFPAIFITGGATFEGRNGACRVARRLASDVCALRDVLIVTGVSCDFPRQAIQVRDLEKWIAEGSVTLPWGPHRLWCKTWYGTPLEKWRQAFGAQVKSA